MKTARVAMRPYLSIYTRPVAYRPLCNCCLDICEQRENVEGYIESLYAVVTQEWCLLLTVDTAGLIVKSCTYDNIYHTARVILWNIFITQGLNPLHDERFNSNSLTTYHELKNMDHNVLLKDNPGAA